jgi:nucleoside-diphosphate-sugar epimerase
MGNDSRRTSILVTGSSGCLGFPLACRLAQEGRRVVGLDLNPPRARAAPYTVVTGDVGDPHLIYRLFDRYDFDGVVHCGGISGQMVASDDPYKNCEVNIFATAHLLEAARLRGVSRFVYCSSQAAYGETGKDAITEHTAFQPMTVYGATKAACDGLVRAYRLQHGLDGVSLRIGRVYGPGRRTDSLIRTLLDAAISGEPLRLPGSGGQALKYVYDADISNALYLALDAAAPPLTSYNVSGPGSYTAEQIGDIVRKLVPTSSFSFEGDGGGLGYERGPLDYSAAERDLGYQPQYDMQRGIAAFVEALRGN